MRVSYYVSCKRQMKQTADTYISATEQSRVPHAASAVIPSTCRFSVVDGTDYGPIRQASAIQNLRREVEELKEQLRDVRKGHASSGEHDNTGGSHTKLCSNTRYLGARCHAKKKPAVLTYDREETVGGSPEWLVNLVV